MSQHTDEPIPPLSAGPTIPAQVKPTPQTSPALPDLKSIMNAAMSDPQTVAKAISEASKAVAKYPWESLLVLLASAGGATVGVVGPPSSIVVRATLIAASSLVGAVTVWQRHITARGKP